MILIEEHSVTAIRIKLGFILQWERASQINPAFDFRKGNYIKMRQLAKIPLK